MRSICAFSFARSAHLYSPAYVQSTCPISLLTVAAPAALDTGHWTDNRYAASYRVGSPSLLTVSVRSSVLSATRAFNVPNTGISPRCRLHNSCWLTGHPPCLSRRGAPTFALRRPSSRVPRSQSQSRPVATRIVFGRFFPLGCSEPEGNRGTVGWLRQSVAGRRLGEEAERGGWTSCGVARSAGPAISGSLGLAESGRCVERARARLNGEASWTVR